jgi:hypothetical protein
LTLDQKKGIFSHGVDSSDAKKGAVMLAVREIINSNALKNVFNLPPGLRNRTVEVLILPVDEQLSSRPTFCPEEFAGVLKLDDAETAARSIRDEWERC